MNKRRQFCVIFLLLAGVFVFGGCASLPANKSRAPKPSLRCIKSSFGAIIRGDPTRKALALAFTGDEFAGGGETILNDLRRRQAKGSFFLTGNFLTNTTFVPLVKRIAAEGHYFSVHSDKHLLYCSWEKERQTLVTQAELQADLEMNHRRFVRLNLAQPPGRYFIPPFEHYNQQIVTWAHEKDFILINYTPGTRSHADYTREADKNFTSSQVIFDSIVKREQTDPHGLNGFILLLHIGSGPGRADKFHARFGELLDYLAGKGYEFVRVDELLESKDHP
ncbi:MAG: polysaccharide deacetylase family protein [Verrucomicrobiota bacterium]